MSERIPCDECVCEDDVRWRKCVTDRLDDGHTRMGQLESEVKNIKSDTAELVEILKAVKGGLKVLQVLGEVIKWGSGIAVAIGAIIAIFQGKWPGK